ncbi:MAG: SAM-dependent methyltransferase [Thermoanaerobaculia bacterium]
MASVEERLRDRLASGPLTFHDFMEEALYGEGGYYAGSRAPVGEEGDFVTGSSVSPLFGAATARLLGRLDAALGTPADYLEAGYGNGEHAAAVAAARGRGDGLLLAWDRVARPLPPDTAGVECLGKLPERPLCGLVFSYELFDALPVHRLVGREGGGLGELWVTLDARGSFAWREGELSEEDLPERCGLEASDLDPGQIADLAPGWGPLLADLAARLERGLLVTCDYGYERPRLLDPRVRRTGTLACYRGHTVHRDPFREIGRQDLTAHVDWTTLIDAGEAAGLATVALAPQALWLTELGIFDELGEADLPTRLAAARLLDPQGMGSDLQVLVQARDVEAADLFALDRLARRR